MPPKSAIRSGVSSIQVRSLFNIRQISMDIVAAIFVVMFAGGFTLWYLHGKFDDRMQESEGFTYDGIRSSYPKLIIYFFDKESEDFKFLTKYGKPYLYFSMLFELYFFSVCTFFLFVAIS